MPNLRRPRRGGRQPKHRSHLEDKVITDLESRGIPYEYEAKTFSFDFPVYGGRCTECGSKYVVVKRKYTPDIFLNNNVIIEIKGKFTGEARTKYQAFLASPEGRKVDLRFIFQRNNWINKNHKNKYSDWCEKLGLKWHVGESVPEEWLDGAVPNS